MGQQRLNDLAILSFERQIERHIARKVEHHYNYCLKGVYINLALQPAVLTNRKHVYQLSTKVSAVFCSSNTKQKFPEGND